MKRIRHLLRPRTPETKMGPNNQEENTWNESILEDKDEILKPDHRLLNGSPIIYLESDISATISPPMSRAAIYANWARYCTHA